MSQLPKSPVKAPSRLFKTSVQLTPTLVAWLESNPLGIEGRGSTPSATIRAILEREMAGDGARARAEKLQELTERVEKLEALSATWHNGDVIQPADDNPSLPIDHGELIGTIRFLYVCMKQGNPPDWEGMTESRKKAVREILDILTQMRDAPSTCRPLLPDENEFEYVRRWLLDNRSVEEEDLACL